MTQRGTFIAIEGLDGSGGTTQTRLLAQALRARGHELLTTREPSDGPVGRLIRAALRGQTAGLHDDIGVEAGNLADNVLPYLFAADRRDHLDRVILPAMERGAWVISDRYFPSSLAYQSLAAPFEFVAGLNAEFPVADLTLMLDLSPQACLDRIEARGQARERFETLERLMAIQSGYDRALRWVESRGGRVLRLDGAMAPELIRDQALGALA